MLVLSDQPHTKPEPPVDGEVEPQHEHSEKELPHHEHSRRQLGHDGGIR